jgi:acyl carrier protein
LRQNDLSTETIQSWLVSRLAAVLEVEPDDIDIREPFARYGLDSIQAVSITGELEEWLGRELPATLVWEYPNIDALATYLSDLYVISKSAANTDQG